MKPFSEIRSRLRRWPAVVAVAALTVAGLTAIPAGAAATELAVPTGFTAQQNMQADVLSVVPAVAEAPTRSVALPQASSGRVTLGQGVYAPQATRTLQNALRINWRARFLNYPSTGTFGHLTKMALMNWQMAAQYPVTGTIRTGTDQWNQLMAERLLGANIKHQSRYVAHLPVLPHSQTRGRIAYVSLTDLRAYFVENGRVQFSVPIRVGRPSAPTPVGTFWVQRHVWNDVSRIFDDAPMPRSVYFTNTGVAFHQSPDFAVTGYSYWSHGCVNIASLADATRIYRWLRDGDRVIVYYRYGGIRTRQYANMSRF